MTATRTIGQLPAVAFSTDDMLFEVEIGGEGRRWTLGDLRAAILPQGIPALDGIYADLVSHAATLAQLVDTYGTTEGAAAAAAAAEAARLAAVAARGLAEQHAATSLANVQAVRDDLLDLDAAVGVRLGQLDTGLLTREAADRKFDRALATIGQALLRTTAEADRTRQILRDAGITVDPNSGTVRIYGVDQVADRTSSVELALDAVKGQIALRASIDYVNERILAAQLDPSQIVGLTALLARMSTAEVNIDAVTSSVNSRATIVELNGAKARITEAENDISALEGAITSKVEQTAFDNLSATVGSVEQTLQTLGDVSGVSITIRQARAVADGAAQAALRTLLAGDEANRLQIDAQALIKQDTYARISDGLATEAASRTQLAAQVGGIDARLASEILVRIADGIAVAQQMLALSAAQNGLSVGLTSANQARAAGDTALGERIDTTVAQAGQVEARVTAAETAIATLDGLTEAYVEKRASVPGAEAAVILRARNDNGDISSSVALVAETIKLQSQAGQVVRGGLTVEGSEVRIDGSLAVTTTIRVGTGRLKLAIAPTDYQVSDGVPQSFGLTFDNPPQITFGQCPVALNSGEVFQPYAEVTTTGFTPRLKINAAPVTTSRASGPFPNVGGGVYEYDASSLPGAANGQYTLHVDLSCVATTWTNTDDNGSVYFANGSVTYAVYAKIGSVWEKLAAPTISFHAFGPGAPPTVNMTGSDIVVVTANGTPTRFRVIIESVNFGDSAQIDAVPNCEWTSQTVSSSRSATPSGEKMTATMRPVY